MSDSARPKLTGDLLDANEINRELPVVVTAGEAMATTPVALYIKSADGKLYKTDASFSDERVHNFAGFGMDAAGGSGSPVALQTHGVVVGFSGLQTSEAYYLSDTSGAIGTPRGTYVVLVGIAVSSTELLITKVDKLRVIRYVVSDVLQVSADTERSKINDSNMTLVKEIVVRHSGVIRVKFDFKASSGGEGNAIAAQIYRNGAVFGTERINPTTEWVNFSQDLMLSPDVNQLINEDDRIQLYYKTKPTESISVNVRNFRIYFNVAPVVDMVVNTD